MISAQTRKEAIRVIATWRLTHGVSDEAVAELLQQLSEVPGNKSWTESTAAMVQLYGGPR